MAELHAVGEWPEPQGEPGWTEWLRRWTGMDRAVAYLVAARICQIVGSVGTVLLIAHLLTPLEQGYYYTLLSLIALQSIFELGFSFVVLQMAAHESARLSFQDGEVQGEIAAHCRLASVLQKAVFWYAVAATLMFALLLPAGAWFFQQHRQAAGAVNWWWPWLATVAACAAAFLLTPLLSFLEGCGFVPQVAALRLAQALAGTAAAWAAMLAHHGLYSPALVLAANFLVGCVFLAGRRRLFLGLMRVRPGAHEVAWRSEVWPFQWRIAMSWLCSYFMAQIFMPVLFATRGAVAAGRLGMSLSISGYLSSVVLAWMTTKAAPFGSLVARGERGALDCLFFRTLRQSLVLLAALDAGCLLGVLALGRWFPQLAARMASPGIFVLLLATGLSLYAVQSIGIYLRAHKREPFLWQSLAVAALTAGSAVPLARAWGVAGVSAGYFLFSGVFALSSAVFIFARRAEAA